MGIQLNGFRTLYVDAGMWWNVIGSDSVTAVSESDIEAAESQTSRSPPDSLPVIRQSGASSAIDDVVAHVDAAGMATTPVAHGDVVVGMNEDVMQVVDIVNDIRNIVHSISSFLQP